METEFTFEGVKYVGLSVLTFGDYGGAGSVGRANIDTLLEDGTKTSEQVSFSLIRDIETLSKRTGNATVFELLACSYEGGKFFPDNGAFPIPDMFHAVGGYSSETLYLREDKFEDEITALSDYPVLDDEKLSEIKTQWESDAFESWAKNDLLRKLDESLRDRFDALPDDRQDETAWNAYRAAMELENEYPETEYNGSYIPVDRIKDAFAVALDAAIRNL